MQPEGTPHPPRGEVAAAISTAIVHLLREFTGRGPTRAKSHVSDDLVTVVLQETLTAGERRLVEFGESGSVLHTRELFQQAMSGQMIEVVERESGRGVVAFLSANHIAPDIAIESFVLAPET